MKKGQIVEGIVERVDFPNKGTVIVEEKAENGEITKHRVEVKGVIPGQKVRLSIKKARKGKAKGMLREVLEKSSIETAQPECPHFGTCGGCSYQTIPYEKQLELKKNQVLDLLILSLMGFCQVRNSGSTATKWSFLLGMRLKMVR